MKVFWSWPAALTDAFLKNLAIWVAGFGNADEGAERIEENELDGYLSALITVGLLPVRSEMIP